jgi:hypothetical protein
MLRRERFALGLPFVVLLSLANCSRTISELPLDCELLLDDEVELPEDSEAWRLRLAVDPFVSLSGDELLLEDEATLLREDSDGWSSRAKPKSEAAPLAC